MLSVDGICSGNDDKFNNNQPICQKNGKCGGDCSKFSEKVSDLDQQTRKALSYNLLKHTTIQIEEEVESLCATQDLNDSKRNTLVAEREVSNSTLPCYIVTFLFSG